MNTHKRGVIRIGSNYARLLLSFLLGLILIRLFLRFGNDAYALIALLGAGTGLAALLETVVRTSTVPELAAAHHSSDANRFRSTYNTAILLCILAAALTLVAFGLLAWLLPLLNIPDSLLRAGALFIAAKAVQTFFVISLAPTFNMYIVSERMVAFNAWRIAERTVDVVAALLVLLAVNDDEAVSIVVYGAASAGLRIGALVTSSVLIMFSDNRLRFAPRTASRAAAGSLFHSVSWNSIIVASMSLYARVDTIIMNAVFGLFGSLVFGLASQLTSYVRQLTMGLVIGVDAVSARLTGGSDLTAVRRLVAQSTRLQGIIVFPATLGVFAFADPLFHYWIGQRLTDPETSLPAVVTLARILVLGVSARSLSEGWMRILAGAGRVKSYAHIVLLGGVANPLLAGIALMIFPEAVRYTAPACVFTVLLLIVHLGLLPTIVARELDVPYSEIVAPLLRPFLAVLLCLPAVVPAMFVSAWTLHRFVSLCLAFGALYALALTWIVAEASERRRATRLVWSRLNRLKTT